jgi:hypothetical protein
MGRGSRFELVSVDDDSGYWGNAYLGRAMAMIDYDRNGTIDFLVNHLDQPLALLENQTKTAGNWIQFELVGTASERDAIGARVVVSCGNEQFTQWVTAGDGYFCSDEAVIDIGIGTSKQVDRFEVFWPSGRHQTFDKAGRTAVQDQKWISSGERYLVVEGEEELYVR